MNFWQLRSQFYDLICFNVNQVYVWQPDFDKNNLTRWVKQNYAELRGSELLPQQFLNSFAIIF